jgi:hypothetical protein
VFHYCNPWQLVDFGIEIAARTPNKDVEVIDGMIERLEKLKQSLE